MMIRIIRFALAVISAVAIASCGAGYPVEPATFNVNDVTDASKAKLLDTVSRSLKAQGFEDLGRYD